MILFEIWIKFLLDQNTIYHDNVLCYDVWKQKKRNLKYACFEGMTKHCNEIMGVLPQI